MKKNKLILQMLAAFGALGADVMARVDARSCYRRFRRRAARLGIKVPKAEW